MDEESDKLEEEMGDGKIWLGAPGSRLQKNTEDITKFLNEMVQSRAYGESPMTCSPASLYICGSPGIGKTTAVNWCAEKVMKSSKRLLNSQNIRPVLVNINCTHLAGASKLETNLFEELRTQCALRDGDAKKLVEKAIKSSRQNDPKRLVILVLDEIDQFIDATTSVEGPKTAGEKLLRELGDWSRDPSCRFVLIGIGNAMNNNKYRRIGKFVQVRSTFFSSVETDHLFLIVSNPFCYSYLCSSKEQSRSTTTSPRTLNTS